MMHLLRVLTLLPLAAAALAACDDLDSNPPATEQDSPGDLRAVVEIDTRYREPVEESDESGDSEDEIFSTVIQLRLIQGEGDEAVNILLEDEDTLEAITAAGPVELQQGQNSQGRLVYGHRFDSAVTADRLTVSLKRVTPPPEAPWFPANDSAEVDFSEYFVDAPNTRIDLPPEVTVNSPADGEGFFVEDGVEVPFRWSPNNVWTPDNVSKPDTTDNDIDDGIGTAHTLEYRTECQHTSQTIEAWFEIEGDPGEKIIPVSDFFRDQLDPDTPLILTPGLSLCRVEFTLIRHSTGIVDPALADTSRINATLRSRQSTIFLCPDSFDNCPPDDDS